MIFADEGAALSRPSMLRGDRNPECTGYDGVPRASQSRLNFHSPPPCSSGSAPAPRGSDKRSSFNPGFSNFGSALVYLRLLASLNLMKVGRKLRILFGRRYIPYETAGDNDSALRDSRNCCKGSRSHHAHLFKITLQLVEGLGIVVQLVEGLISTRHMHNSCTRCMESKQLGVWKPCVRVV